MKRETYLSKFFYDSRTLTKSDRRRYGFAAGSDRRRYGFAAGCEAGLRPAVHVLLTIGLSPWLGLGPNQFRGAQPERGA